MEYTLLKSDYHRWWISKMQSGREDTSRERYAIKFCFKLGKNATEKYGSSDCFWSILHESRILFWCGIRNSRKTGSQWGMIRSVRRVRKSIDESWLATGLGLGFYVEVLREFRKRFCRKRPAVFKSGQWHFHQDNALVHYSILVTDYLAKMGIKTVPQPPHSPDLAPCDF